jgi:hypothetical protein
MKHRKIDSLQYYWIKSKFLWIYFYNFEKKSKFITSMRINVRFIQLKWNTAIFMPSGTSKMLVFSCFWYKIHGSQGIFFIC